MLAVRKALGLLVSLIALAGVLMTVVLATRRIDQRPRTDDAYLQADLVHMAPDISGRIVELEVRDNQTVRLLRCGSQEDVRQDGRRRLCQVYGASCRLRLRGAPRHRPFVGRIP